MARQRARYVDGFVLVIPRTNIAASRRVAARAGKAGRKYGALDYTECVGDDLSLRGMGKTRGFSVLVDA